MKKTGADKQPSEQDGPLSMFPKHQEFADRAFGNIAEVIPNTRSHQLAQRVESSLASGRFSAERGEASSGESVLGT
jgi:hypothetical protein